MKTIKGIIRLLRPRQWVKNGFVFAAIIFSKNLFERDMLIKVALAFAAMCLASSCVYVLNDLADAERDALHPIKKNRPIASGEVSREAAICCLAVLFAAAGALALRLGTGFALTVGVYLLVNVAYSLALKNIVIIDVMCVALGFVLRVIAGSVVISVEPSQWLIVCTFLLALFLAVNKRRCEMSAVGGGEAGATRGVLRKYSPELLKSMSSAIDSATIIAYCMYVINLRESIIMTATIPFVLYGLFRYQYLVDADNSGESPELILLRDKPMIINILLWVAACVYALYFYKA